MITKPDQIEDPQGARDDLEKHTRTPTVLRHELIKKLEIAEKKLSFLGLVVASSVESVVTVDFDSIITTWNAAAERLYGYPASEAVGKPLTMLTLPEDLRQVLAKIEDIKEGRAVETFDTVRIRKGGAEIDLEILMSPVKDVAGNVIGVATMARDITERIRLTAEREALRVAEAELKARELAGVRRSETQLAESQMRLAMELSATQHLQEVSTQLIGTDSPTTLYENILDSSLQIMRAQYASIQLLFPERGTGGELWLMGYRGFTPEAARYWEWVSLESGSACGQALRTGERVIIPNIEADKQMIDSENRAIFIQTGILAVQATPLVSRGGRLLGILSTHWNRPHTPTARDFRLLDVLARQAADLIERKGAEELLRESEVKYRTLFESIDEGFCLLEVLFDESGEAYDYVFLEANAAFERQSGLVDAAGRTVLELVPGLEPQWVRLYGQVATTGEPIRFEADVSSMGRFFDIYAFRGGSLGQNKVAVVFNDITERKRSEANLAFFAEVSQDLTQLTNIDETMNALGEKIGGHFRTSICSFLEIDAEREIAVVTHEWCTEDAVSLIGEYRLVDYGTWEQLAAWRSGKPFVVRDAESDDRVNSEALAALNIASYISIPIQRDREWRYLLTVYDRVARDWREDEIELMRELTSRIWTRLERFRAEQALRESETRYRALATVGSASIYRMSPDWREMHQLDGVGFIVDSDEPTTDWIETYIPADERPRVEEAIERAIRTKDTFELEHRVLRADGTVGWTFSRAIPLLDDAGEITEWFGVASDVTARVKADQSFTRLFEASPAPFLVLAPDAPRFTITEVNDAYLAATIRTREELVGSALFEAFPDNPNEPTINGVGKLRASLEHVLASRQPDTLPGLKYDIARPDGTFEERWWSPVNSPILDENGVVEAIIHNANDVTKERLADTMLRESEERYRTLFNTIDQGYATIEMIFDESGNPVDYVFLEINPAFERITGLKDAAGRSAREIVPGLEEFWFETYGKVALTGEAVRFENHADAMDRWFDVFASRVGGEDSRKVALVFSNVTQRKQAEHSIRFQAHLLNTIEQSAIATDLDGNVTYWNRFAEKLYGWTADEAIGRQIVELTTPEMMAEQAAEIMSELRQGKSWSGEFNVKRRDGSIFPAYVINSPIDAESGELIGIIGISVDITERKRAEEELHQSRQSLERRVVERTRELAETNIALKAENLERRKIEDERVSILQRLVTAQEDVRRRIGRDLHDRLGQHVTALRFKLEAAAKMSGDNSEIKNQIEQAQEYAKQVDTDVDFLTFELRPTALDDLGLIEAVGIFLKEWSQNHNVAADFYSKHFEETLPLEAEINAYRIVQEALNNTLKHAKANSVAVHLYVKDGSLTLIIEDDGVGFEQENIARNTSPGAGLGLIGMRERCLLVGGNLEIESAPGKGTVIFARIPAKAGH